MTKRRGILIFLAGISGCSQLNPPPPPFAIPMAEIHRATVVNQAAPAPTIKTNVVFISWTFPTNRTIPTSNMAAWIESTTDLAQPAWKYEKTVRGTNTHFTNTAPQVFYRLMTVKDP